MRRWFTLFFRGLPFAGSNRRWWSGVAESVLAGVMLLGGVCLLVVSLTLAVLNWGPDGLYISQGFFALQIVLSFALILIGALWIARLIWHIGVSAERRSALATRAGELEILKEIRQPREDLPTVPRDRAAPRAGRKLRFRLIPSARNILGLVTSGLFSVVLTALLTILILIVTRALQNKTSLWEDSIQQSIGPDRLSHFPDVPWLAAALIMPILFACLWSGYQFFRQLLKLTGIGPTELEVCSYPLLPGNTYKVWLSQAGRVRLKLLDVALICQEEATFDQGTDIRTEKKVVYETRLFRQRGVSLRRDNSFETEFDLAIPENAMHSFKSQSNRVQWKIVVTGQAKSWPRLKRNFAVSVFPATQLATRPKAKN